MKLNYKVGLKVLAGAYCRFLFREYNRFNNMKLLLLVVDTKFTIFILLVTVLTTAVFASTINFVSASTTTCFHFGGRYLCYFVFDEVKPPAIAVTNCDNDGTNCTVTWVQQVNVTPDAKNAIKQAQVTKFGGQLSPDAAK